MASASSSSPFLGIRVQEEELQNQMKTPTTPLQFQQQPPQSSSPTSATAVPVVKKRRNQPRDPTDPDAEVIALSPTTLLATNRFVCEVCNKGFQREQNLQLHRRGHNLPWKLRLKSSKDPPRRRVYLCPEPSCVHHDPSRALGDLTGIKKHFCRKHGEKKWKCDKCAKRYAVPSDLKAHAKTCGTREYRCDCGTIFSRRDSFITHRAFCDALAQESTRLPTAGIGGHLYGSNMMAMNLCQVNSQLSSLQEQNNEAAAAAAGAQFQQLVNPLNNPPAQFRAPPAANFYFGNGSNVVQDFDMEEHSLLQRKPFHGLMQLPDLHGNNASSINLFDLGFFSNSGAVEGCCADPAMMFSGSLVGDHAGGAMASSSLYNADSSSSAHPRMSATSLLQKAAQMGSTTTSSGAAAGGPLLLAGFGVNGNPRPPPHFGCSFIAGDTFHTDMDNATSLQNIMNALANGSAGAGLFGGSAPFGESGPRHEAAVVELSSLGGGPDAPDDAKFTLATAAGLAGPDHLTRDFLGVGRMVRTAGAGAMSRRELNHGTYMSAFDPK